MALKLLTPTELKTANSTETARTIARTETTRQALAVLEKKLDITEASFAVTLTKQHEVWAKENEAHVKEIEARKKEIEILEKQRELLLIPIELQCKEAHDLFVQAEQALLESRKIKADSEEVASLLQNRLDDLGEREVDIIQLEKKLKSRELNINDQEISSAKLAKELAVKWQEYWTNEAALKNELSKRERSVELMEISLTNKTEFLDNRELELNKKERWVVDRYQTLIRTQKRLQ